jgi:transposase-like protein
VAFEDTTINLCYFHVVKGLKEHAKEINGGSEYINTSILPKLRLMHQASSEVRFDRLMFAAIKQFINDSQKKFVRTWLHLYTSAKWKNWYVGSLPIVNSTNTNNAMEAFNKVIKQVVTKVVNNFCLFQELNFGTLFLSFLTFFY